MVQVLPQETNLGTQLGQGFSQGAQQGQSLAQQLLPLLLSRGINQGIYGSAQPSSSPQTAPKSQNHASAGSPSANPPMAPPRNEGIFQVRTPQEIESLATRAAQLGGDFGKVQQEYAGQNALGEKNRQRLVDLATKEGFGAGRISELFDYAATRPDLKTPESLLGAAKKEFDKIEKVDLPGLFTGLVGGPEAREKALSNLGPYYDRMRRLGREQEIRSSLSERGITETELGYLSNHRQLPRIDKALSGIQDGIFKPRKDALGFEGSPEEKYQSVLQKNPELIEKQNERLEQFFRENVNPETSLLVLRDKLWRKGYDWHQIAEAVDRAFPDESVLNRNQQTEIAELSQAPIPSPSDLFGGGFWRRFVGQLAGKK